MRAKREVIVLFASESRQVEDHDELRPSLVRPAEVQELLEFGAIGGLRALAFLPEPSENFQTLTLAVLLPALQPRPPPPIPPLLFSAYADVYHPPHPSP